MPNNNEKNEKNNEKKKINFVLSNREYKLVKEVLEQTNLTISDLGRNAVNIYGWVQKQIEEKNIDIPPAELIRISIKTFFALRDSDFKLDPKEVMRNLF